jgi:hypothetical protein
VISAQFVADCCVQTERSRSIRLWTVLVETRVQNYNFRTEEAEIVSACCARREAAYRSISPHTKFLEFEIGSGQIMCLYYSRGARKRLLILLIRQKQ